MRVAVSTTTRVRSERAADDEPHREQAGIELDQTMKPDCGQDILENLKPVNYEESLYALGILIDHQAGEPAVFNVWGGNTGLTFDLSPGQGDGKGPSFSWQQMAQRASLGNIRPVIGTNPTDFVSLKAGLRGIGRFLDRSGAHRDISLRYNRGTVRVGFRDERNRHQEQGFSLAGLHDLAIRTSARRSRLWVRRSKGNGILR